MLSLSSTLVLCLTIPLSVSFPFATQSSDSPTRKRVSVPSAGKDSGEGNTGVQPSYDFDQADQYVDVSPSSKNAFVAPGATDIRGLCPGLNAASNHGFLPHNGIATISQTITGLGDAYNMSPDLAGVLAAIAVALTGDYVTQTWSIGGTYPVSSLDGLLKPPGGIDNSHNKYESDASVTRSDAYLNGGNPAELVMEKFDALYQLTDNFTLDVLREHNYMVHQYSVANNPYYFFAPFAGLVAPAAHEFVINFMSNHSAEYPSGYLNRDILKSFFAVSGPDNAHVHNVGMERIPNNWYRRPTTNQYSAAKNLADTVITGTQYPSILAFGGNIGKPNSFVGVDPSDLTGGVYNGSTLLEGNNLGCFMFQSFEAFLPDQLAGFVADVTPVLDLVKQYTGPILASFECPQLETYNQGLFNQFPGYKYHPQTTK